LKYFLLGLDFEVCKQLNEAKLLQGMGLKKIRPIRIRFFCFLC